MTVLTRFIYLGLIAWAGPVPAASSDASKSVREGCSGYLATDFERARDTYVKMLAFQTAPQLFPRVPYDRDDEANWRALHWYIEHGDETWSAVQTLIDDRLALRSQGLEHLDRLAQRQTFARALVATHVRPQDQTRVAELSNQSCFREMPVIVLAREYPDFAVAEASYFAAADVLLYSRGGEIGVPLAIAHATLIGGFESACLSFTLNALSQRAAERGLHHVKVTIPTEYTYALGDNVSLRDIRDGRVARPKAVAQIEQLLWAWRVKNLRREGLKIVVRAVRSQSTDSLDLVIE